MKGTSLRFISFKYYWIICIIVSLIMWTQNNQKLRNGNRKSQNYNKCRGKTILVSIHKTWICFHFNYRYHNDENTLDFLVSC